jgi:hypothetical protein
MREYWLDSWSVGGRSLRHTFLGPVVARPTFVSSSVAPELSAWFAHWRPAVAPAVCLVLTRPNEPGRRGADTSAYEQVLFHLGRLPFAWEIGHFQSMGYAPNAGVVGHCVDRGAGGG